MHAWDVLVEAPLDDATIAHGLAAILAVPPVSAHVIDEIDPDLEVPAGATALVERSTLRGDARRRLTIYLQTDELIARTAPRSVTMRLLQDLAGRLGTSLFVGDGELDPWGFVRIRPDGIVEAVTIDVERLDDEGFFSVLSNEPPAHDRRLTAPASEPPRRR